MVSLITFANEIPKCMCIHVHTHTHMRCAHVQAHPKRQYPVKCLSTICSKQVLQKPMPSDVPTVTLWERLLTSPHMLPSVESPVLMVQIKVLKNLNSKGTGPQLANYIPYIRERGKGKSYFFRVLLSFWIKK